jgi:hypothetical protein
MNLRSVAVTPARRNRINPDDGSTTRRVRAWSGLVTILAAGRPEHSLRTAQRR